MSDTINHFKLERTPNAHVDGNGNWVLDDPITVLSASIPPTDTSFTDTAAPSPDFFYRLTGYTAAGAEFKYNVVKITTSGPQWAKKLTGSGPVYAQAVAVKANGNIIFAGIFSGAADFGTGTLTSAGGTDIVVAEFTSAGAIIWSKRFGGTSSDSVAKVAVDASGNIVMAGTFQGVMSLGSFTLTSAGGSDLWVAKFSAANHDEPLWAKRFGNAPQENLLALALDASGNVVIGGSFTTTWPTGLDFGGGTPLLSTQNGQDSFIAKLASADGSYVWARSFECGALDVCNGVAVDASGDVYAIGQYQGDINFGLGYITSGGFGSDVYVVKLAGADGTTLWNKSFGGPYGDLSSGIIACPDGNVVVTGYFYSTIDFGGGTLTAQSPYDVFLAKLSGASGSQVWARSFAGNSVEFSTSLAVDANGNVAVCGTFPSNITIPAGGTTLVAQGTSCAFVAKFTSAGGSTWAKVMGGHQKVAGSEATTPTAIAFDASGNVVMMGNFSGTLDTGFGVSLVSTDPSVQDAFLLKMPP